MNEALILLRENNSLLREILAILRKLDSEEYRANDDMRQFCINVVADLFVNQYGKHP